MHGLPGPEVAGGAGTGYTCRVGQETGAADRPIQPRPQAELARITRVTSLGELAASITHEVLQPISDCIQRRSVPALAATAESRDRRSARRSGGHGCRCPSRGRDRKGIHSLAKKSKPERLLFDLNQMLEDVIALIRGELVRHQVSPGKLWFTRAALGTIFISRCRSDDQRHPRAFASTVGAQIGRA